MLHLFSTCGFLKSQSGGPGGEGLLSWSRIWSTAEYGWRQSQLGVGSCCFGRGLERDQRHPILQDDRMVSMDSAAAQKCAAEWAQPTQVHVCLPAGRCWHEIIAILSDLITCDSLMFHNSVQPGFLYMRIFQRAWTMARARYIHLEPLNNAGSKQSM